MFTDPGWIKLLDETDESSTDLVLTVANGTGQLTERNGVVTVALNASGAVTDVMVTIPSQFAIQGGSTFMQSSVTRAAGTGRIGSVTLRLFPAGQIEIFEVPVDWIEDSDVVRFTGTWLTAATGV